MNFHDNDGTTFDAFDLHAGDDAGEVAWVAITPDLKLYASHATFVKTVHDRLVNNKSPGSVGIIIIIISLSLPPFPPPHPLPPPPG